MGPGRGGGHALPASRLPLFGPKSCVIRISAEQARGTRQDHRPRTDDGPQEHPQSGQLLARILGRCDGPAPAGRWALETLAHGKRGHKKRRPVHSLAPRRRDRKGAVLRFLTDSEVPFTRSLGLSVRRCPCPPRRDRTPPPMQALGLANHFSRRAAV